LVQKYQANIIESSHATRKIRSGSLALIVIDVPSNVIAFGSDINSITADAAKRRKVRTDKNANKLNRKRISLYAPQLYRAYFYGIFRRCLKLLAEMCVTIFSEAAPAASILMKRVAVRQSAALSHLPWDKCPARPR